MDVDIACIEAKIPVVQSKVNGVKLRRFVYNSKQWICSLQLLFDCGSLSSKFFITHQSTELFGDTKFWRKKEFFFVCIKKKKL